MNPAIVVCGCGRSGTNVVLELLRGNPIFNASEPEEDKLVFSRYRKIEPGYLTKCDTVYFELEHATNALSVYPFLNIVWTIRDPRDMIMSKLRRGIPEDKGGDCKGYASDSTVSGAIEDIQRAVFFYQGLKSEFGNRIQLVKMEDVLENPMLVSESLCRWLDIKHYKGMIYFWKRMRNKHKSQRYKDIDKSQISMFKNWRGYEDSWFLKSGLDLSNIFKKQEVVTLVKILEYEECL
jgi:hypothetical protein